MNEIDTRSIVTDVDVRKEETSGERIIRGIAVPFNKVISVGGLKESFERGAFGEFKPVKLFYNHDSNHLPIGMVTRGEDTDEGYVIEAKISNTTLGNDVYELLKDKTLDKLSIGFKANQHRNVNGVVVRSAVDLREISIVNDPAYADAVILDVRMSDTKNGNDVPNTERSEMTDSVTSADLNTLRNEIKDEIRSLGDTRNNSNSGPVLKHDSLGAFVKDFYKRTATHEDAEVLTRAFADSADAGVRPAWMDRDIRLVRENRNILELFSKEQLPASGNFVEYPTFSSATGEVGIQGGGSTTVEGADLNYLELAVGEGSAKVETYGGYSRLSRQAIERSSVAYLNKVLDRQKISYARATNGAVRSVLTSATGTNAYALPAAASVAPIDWIKAAVSGAGSIANVGLSADVWIVSPTQFLSLASFKDSDGRPLFVLNGDGVNSFGDLNLKGQFANVGGLKVVSDPTLTGIASYIVSSEAITVLERGPFNLDDENIVNLTKDFSIYGYMAVTLNDPKGVTKVTHTA